MKSKKIDIRKTAYLAVLTALVIVLQMFCAFIKFGPFQVTTALVPIAIGAILCGAWGGAWLGLVFGTVVLANGDAAAFLAVNPSATIAVVLLKGVLCGCVAGIVFKALKNFNSLVASIVASLVCPIVNTGVFAIGCYAFFFDTLTSWAGGAGYDDTTKYIFMGMIGANFFFEMLLSAVLSPAVARVVSVVQRKMSKRA